LIPYFATDLNPYEEILSDPNPNSNSNSNDHIRGCIITRSDMLGEKSFLNLIDKNIPILIIVDEVNEIDLQEFIIKEIDFIDYRLGLMSYGVHQIPDSINTYFNGVCIEINMKDLM
jgi:hypothetical protein